MPDQCPINARSMPPQCCTVRPAHHATHAGHPGRQVGQIKHSQRSNDQRTPASTRTPRTPASTRRPHTPPQIILWTKLSPALHLRSRLRHNGLTVNAIRQNIIPHDGKARIGRLTRHNKSSCAPGFSTKLFIRSVIFDCIQFMLAMRFASCGLFM